MWQDLVLSVIGISFAVTLIPQLIDSIKGKSQINLLTSSITGLGCLLICLVDITLNLYIAAIVSFITGIIWLIFFGISLRSNDSMNKLQKRLNRVISNIIILKRL